MVDAVKVFKALGDESRLRIIAALQGERTCVCKLASLLGMPQPTLSHHLKVLRDAGLVVGEKDGSLIHCRLDTGAFAGIGLDLQVLLAHLPD